MNGPACGLTTSMSTPGDACVARAQVGAHVFDFPLTLKRLKLPSAGVGGGEIRYWDTGVPALRQRGGGKAGQAAVEFWWACQFAGGRNPDAEDIEHYLLALAHLRLAGGHGCFDVFRAGLLSRRADRERAADPELVGRLARRLDEAGPGFVQGELEALFLRHEGRRYGGAGEPLDPPMQPDDDLRTTRPTTAATSVAAPADRVDGGEAEGNVDGEEDVYGRDDVRGLPDPGDMDFYDGEFGRVLHAGIDASSEGGRAGVGRWLDDVARADRKARRRGTGKQCKATGGRLPRFANAFAYECMARFHVCLAHAWEAAIVPWLKANRGLDPLSERFLLVMHQVHLPGDDEAASGRRRGVLFGYPLARHPVGRWMLGRPECVEAVAAWAGHPAQDRLCRAATAWDGCGEYRSFLLHVLLAAHEYEACRRYEETTGRPVRRGRGRGAARNVADLSALAWRRRPGPPTSQTASTKAAMTGGDEPRGGVETGDVTARDPRRRDRGGGDQRSRLSAAVNRVVGPRAACRWCHGAGGLAFVKPLHCGHGASHGHAFDVREGEDVSIIAEFLCGRCRRASELEIGAGDLRAAAAAEAARAGRGAAAAALVPSVWPNLATASRVRNACA